MSDLQQLYAEYNLQPEEGVEDHVLADSSTFSPDSPNNDVAVIEEEATPWGGAFSADGVAPDGAGYLFMVHVRNGPDAQNQAIAVLEKRAGSPPWSLVERWLVVLPNNTKADSVGIMADPYQNYVDVYKTGHSSAARIHRSLRRIDGIYTPHPRPGGGGGSLPPLPNPGSQIFADVDENNPFYAGINSLVRMGAMSGYDDGTFRPNNPLTRGQAAKIIYGAIRFLYGQQ